MIDTGKLSEAFWTDMIGAGSCPKKYIDAIAAWLLVNSENPARELDSEVGRYIIQRCDGDQSLLNRLRAGFRSQDAYGEFLSWTQGLQIPKSEPDLPIDHFDPDDTVPDWYVDREFGTQGGGIVVAVSYNTYLFIEPPKSGPWQVGDQMPTEWGLIPLD